MSWEFGGDSGGGGSVTSVFGRTGVVVAVSGDYTYQQISNTPTPLTPTPVKTANYSANAADFVAADVSGGSFTVTLPSAPADGTVVACKIVNWASGDALTIAASGTDVFNIASGVTSLILIYNLQSVILQYKLSTGIWYVIASDVGNALNSAIQNTQTASYTLVLADAGKIVEMNVGSANNLTVPPNSGVAFPIGTAIAICQIGAGLTTIVAGSGVTIDSLSGTLVMAGQYATASLRKRGTNEWVLAGGL